MRPRGHGSPDALKRRLACIFVQANSGCAARELPPLLPRQHRGADIRKATGLARRDRPDLAIRDRRIILAEVLAVLQPAWFNADRQPHRRRCSLYPSSGWPDEGNKQTSSLLRQSLDGNSKSRCQSRR